MRVLITGTSSGIGLATAVVLERAGHRVYATTRNPNRAPQLREIVAREQLPLSIMTMDVDSHQSVNDVLQEVHQNGGGLDVLVNNAGIERLGSVEELTLDAFRAVMETNYFGSLRFIRAVLPKMRQSRGGCIITVSSVASRFSC